MALHLSHANACVGQSPHRFIAVSARVGGVRSVVITYISVYVC